MLQQASLWPWDAGIVDMMGELVLIVELLLSYVLAISLFKIEKKQW
jgi:hypothetical protein